MVQSPASCLYSSLRTTCSTLIFKRPSGLASKVHRACSPAPTRGSNRRNFEAGPPAPAAGRSVAAMPGARDRSSAFLDVLLFPLLGRHRLVANGVPRTDLDLVDEHAEVLADRDERPMLVVHLHAQTVRGLRNL